MLSPIEAVTHPDPYPYYAELVAERPVYYDEALRCWVLSSAAAVSAALASPDCLVRPAAEPVPSGLVGTAAGAVFGELVRMTDGQFHDRLKTVVRDALGQVQPDRVRELAGARAQAILAGADDPLTELMFGLPAQVVAALCGLTAGTDERAARLIGDFVLCLPATASPEQQARAARAAAELQELLGPLLDEGSDGLLGELVRAARRADWPDQAPLLANGIGFLSQTYDATAGLIGNGLLALDRQQVPAGELTGFLTEVARHDSPVHNTRRFAARPTELCGTPIGQGDSLLLLLAAANRDPAVNPEPERFWPDRPQATLFTFGAGGHDCPGQRLAVGIASAALAGVLAAGLDVPALCAGGVGYRPSGNVRVPVFAAAAAVTASAGRL